MKKVAAHQYIDFYLNITTIEDDHTILGEGMKNRAMLVCWL